MTQRFIGPPYVLKSAPFNSRKGICDTDGGNISHDVLRFYLG